MKTPDHVELKQYLQEIIKQQTVSVVSDYKTAQPPRISVAKFDISNKSELEELLRMKTIEACAAQNIDFFLMHPVSRISLTHYRCSSCGLQPLYCLDIRCLNKPRCGVCGNIVSLKNGGKHGRLRKKIAIALHVSNR